MKRLSSWVAVLTLIAGNLFLFQSPAQAAPADYAAWPICAQAADQYCVESSQITLTNGTTSTLAAQGVTLEAYFYDALAYKSIAVNLLQNGNQAISAALLGATVSYKLRTSTWIPADMISGQAGYVSNLVEHTGDYYSISSSVKTIHYEVNDACTLDAKCEVPGKGIYPAYLQVSYYHSEKNVQLLSVLGTSANVEPNFNWQTSKNSIRFAQPTTAPFSVEVLIPAKMLKETLGTTAALFAQKFSAALSLEGVPTGSASIKVAGTAALVTATANAGGRLILTMNPKVALPKPVISDVKFINKTKQTVVVKANKAASVIQMTCQSDAGARKVATYRTFTFTPTMAKGSWSCYAQFSNGFLGPISNPFSLYNKG